jgi:hypothetical protein
MSWHCFPVQPTLFQLSLRLRTALLFNTRQRRQFMELVTRPWITAGVALVGAGVVAAIPMAGSAPSLPVVQARAVQLTTGADPLTDWGDVLQTAEANATDIYDHFSSAPFADLQQSLVNDVGYVEDLIKNPSDIGTIATDIQDNLNALFGGTAADPGALWGPFLPPGGATDTLTSRWTTWSSPGELGYLVLVVKTTPNFSPFFKTRFRASPPTRTSRRRLARCWMSLLPR